MKTTLLLCVCLATALLSGCGASMTRSTPMEMWSDMKHQGKFKPQTVSAVFADGRSSRAPVPGTVARGYLNDDDAFHTGVVDGMYIGKNPLPLDAALLHQGQLRYNTYCAPCHSRVGDGKGIVALKTPSWQPANLHEDRMRAMADGELYNVVSYGRRSMSGYRFQVVDRDRWAIVAYVRALQRTDGKIDDVPQELRADLR